VDVSERDSKDLVGEVEWLSDMIALLKDPPSESPFSGSPWTWESRAAWVRRWDGEREDLIAELRRRDELASFGAPRRGRFSERIRRRRKRGG
jgi:hypothetical protein